MKFYRYSVIFWYTGSLPSRERGLKFYKVCKILPGDVVAPLAGAWIEISVNIKVHEGDAVAPLAGAWIEISLSRLQSNFHQVAPLAGAWIEISIIGIL